MQLGDKKLVVQRASVGAKGGSNNQAPVHVQASLICNLYILYIIYMTYIYIISHVSIYSNSQLQLCPMLTKH